MATQTIGEGTDALPAPHLREWPARDLAGLPVLGLGLVALLGGIALVRSGKVGAATGHQVMIGIGIVLIVLGVLVLAGLTTVAPGQARVVQLFGRYCGTVRASGLRWVYPTGCRTTGRTGVRRGPAG